MKRLLTILLIAISFLSLSQNYPVQTILKGDSVVIYTVEQNDDIEILLENQRSRVAFYKNNIAKQQNAIDSLNQELIEQKAKQQTIIDSIQAVADGLRFTLKNKFGNYDSLQQRYDSVNTWLYNTAADHAFIYYSYIKSTIVAIDLASYIIVGYKRSGNFSVARRGPVSDDLYWKNYNREMKDEPNEDWLTHYKARWRPTQIQFPYQILPKP